MPNIRTRMNIYLRLDSRNKAKHDIDDVMEREGFRNVAVGSCWEGKVARFFAKLLSVVALPFRAGKGDVLLIQYPFKKYYPSLCRIMRWRGGRTVTLIHDLGCFRRKKLTVEDEIVKLSRTDVLIVHNESMQQFLLDHGYKRPMLTLGIFDYLSVNQPVAVPQHTEGKGWDVVYAGSLAERKNQFLYLLDEALPGDCCWTLNIHGRGLDEAKAATWNHIRACGFIQSDNFIRESVGHFGLVWDGSSIDECAGAWGEYLKVNNPHKTSFYLRAGKPVIIWKDAALARFVEQKGVGITVGSLREIHERLAAISEEEYLQMCRNVRAIQQELAEGHYFKEAFHKAQSLL